MTSDTPAPRAVLDCAGAHPVDPRVRDAYVEALEQGWADPRRLHSEGRRARLLLDGARESLAADLGARTEELRLLGSHTLALHAAVRAVVRGRRRVGPGVVSSAVERAAVLEAARFAGERRDVRVDATGRVDLDDLAARLGEPGVALAALQHANGEVGTVQPVAAAHELARHAGVPLLVDAGSSVGHADLDGLPWDLLAADPADWGAPRGLGVLALRARVRAAPDWPEDEDTWSPGGVSVPAAIASAVALRLAHEARAQSDATRRSLVDRLRARVAAEVPDVEVVGDPVDRLPHVVTFSCLYVDGEALVTALDRAGFAVSSGSACTSASTEPSHVLAAMGVLTHGNVRVTLPFDTRAEDVERFCDVLPGAVAAVRSALGADRL